MGTCKGMSWVQSAQTLGIFFGCPCRRNHRILVFQRGAQFLETTKAAKLDSQGFL